MPTAQRAPSEVGRLLRQWRQVRRMSQQALADEAEVSARHLSYLENGRSQPSRQMVLILASALDVPLRERNTLLGAAGYSPAYTRVGLDEEAAQQARRALEFLLERSEPYPALVVDHVWQIQMANAAAQRFVGWLMGDRPPGSGNILEALVDPEQLRPFVANFAQLGAEMLRRLRRVARENEHRRPLSTSATASASSSCPPSPRWAHPPTSPCRSCAWRPSSRLTRPRGRSSTAVSAPLRALWRLFA
jgi:transcriptional regulator with XRE-family HTH domain